MFTRVVATRQGQGSAYLVPFVLFFLVLASRIPFIGPGYGNIGDAWRFALVADYIQNSGQYAASRLPGYPLVELSYAAIAALGDMSPVSFNLMSAIMSAFAAVAFFKILELLRLKYSFLITIGMFLVPVILINSVISMDYMWAACFFLWSFYFCLRRNYILSGVFLGLAGGARYHSALMG